MAGTLKLLAGPAYLAAAAANVYVPSSALIYAILRHIHLFNTDTVARTFSLYIGATGGSAGGTEVFKTMSIAANSPYDFYPLTKLTSTQFLSGLASSASTITIMVEGEENVV